MTDSAMGWGVEGAAGAPRAAQDAPPAEGRAAHGAGAGGGRGLCGAAESGGRGEIVHVGGANCSEPLINGSLWSRGGEGRTRQRATDSRCECRGALRPARVGGGSILPTAALSGWRLPRGVEHVHLRESVVYLQ